MLYLTRFMRFMFFRLYFMTRLVSVKRVWDVDSRTLTTLG